MSQGPWHQRDVSSQLFCKVARFACVIRQACLCPASRKRQDAAHGADQAAGGQWGSSGKEGRAGWADLSSSRLGSGASFTLRVGGATLGGGPREPKRASAREWRDQPTVLGRNPDATWLPPVLVPHLCLRRSQRGAGSRCLRTRPGRPPARRLVWPDRRIAGTTPCNLRLELRQVRRGRRVLRKGAPQPSSPRPVVFGARAKQRCNPRVPGPVAQCESSETFKHSGLFLGRVAGGLHPEEEEVLTAVQPHGHTGTRVVTSRAAQHMGHPLCQRNALFRCG